MTNDVVVPEGVQLDFLIDELRKLSWNAADVLMAYARGDQPPFGFPKVLTVQDEQAPSNFTLTVFFSIATKDISPPSFLRKGLISSKANSILFFNLLFIVIFLQQSNLPLLLSLKFLKEVILYFF